MRGRTNISGGGGADLKGVLREYQVAPSNTIEAGDFVQFEQQFSSGTLISGRLQVSKTSPVFECNGEMICFYMKYNDRNVYLERKTVLDNSITLVGVETTIPISEIYSESDIKDIVTMRASNNEFILCVNGRFRIGTDYFYQIRLYKVQVNPVGSVSTELGRYESSATSDRIDEFILLSPTKAFVPFYRPNGSYFNVYAIVVDFYDTPSSIGTLKQLTSGVQKPYRGVYSMYSESRIASFFGPRGVLLDIDGTDIVISRTATFAVNVQSTSNARMYLGSDKTLVHDSTSDSSNIATLQGFILTFNDTLNTHTTIDICRCVVPSSVSGSTPGLSLITPLEDGLVGVGCSVTKQSYSGSYYNTINYVLWGIFPLNDLTNGSAPLVETLFRNDYSNIQAPYYSYAHTIIKGSAFNICTAHTRYTYDTITSGPLVGALFEIDEGNNITSLTSQTTVKKYYNVINGVANQDGTAGQTIEVWTPS